jgi:hypothetical protein
MDAPNKTANQHLSPNPGGHVPNAPDTLPPLVVHVPDFKDPATSSDFEPCKHMFLDCQMQSTETTEAGNLKRATAEYDKIDLYNESVCFNHEKILRWVMQESFETWKVKNILKIASLGGVHIRRP